MTINEAWEKALEIIEKDMSEVDFSAWIKPLSPECVTEDDFVLYTKDEQVKAMIEEHYDYIIWNAVAMTARREYTIKVVNDKYAGELIIPSMLIEDGVLKRIADWAERVVIPADVHKVATGLGRFNNVNYIDVVDGNEYFTSVEGVLFTKDMKRLVAYPNKREAEEYVIPNGVEFVEGEAFGMNKNLKSVVMPDSVKKVGDYAFYGNCNLENVRLSENLEYISEFMLDGCSKLKEIKIPDSVKEIKRYAFRDCKELTSVKIPEEVFCIEEYAFANCEKLKSVFLNVATIEKNAFRGSRNVTLYSEFECVEEYAEKSKIKFKKTDL